ncbi:hypothetical protein RVR_3811 [Actinacidiphila reveromycinica]|uniref:Uncharacterized protein n=1 Tax=Actinacidiphila reveromycinica TaxID=659352 RepID=A0A7U3VNR9_9ACTN|nr:hypothetical protein [Streptomyces sp. SN-593]BBA97864.1 hypothetical protein RVR_3811 [Streptomyces sp. SN-593]
MPSRHPRGFTCGRRSFVPPRLLTAALRVANAASPAWDGLAYMAEDAATLLVCTLQAHRGPVHRSVVLNLRGPVAGTVWAAWRDGIEPYLAVLLPDCPVTTADGDEACSEFARHPDAHSWELADPALPPSLLALFGPLLAEQDRPPDGRVLDATTRFHRPTTNRKNPAQ